MKFALHAHPDLHRRPVRRGGMLHHRPAHKRHAREQPGDAHIRTSVVYWLKQRGAYLSLLVWCVHRARSRRALRIEGLCNDRTCERCKRSQRPRRPSRPGRLWARRCAQRASLPTPFPRHTPGGSCHSPVCVLEPPRRVSHVGPASASCDRRVISPHASPDPASLPDVRRTLSAASAEATVRR